MRSVSPMLGKLIHLGLTVGMMASAELAFASCNEPGRPACSDEHVLDRITVLGWLPSPYSPAPTFNPSHSCPQGCDFEWDDYGSGTGGGPSTHPGFPFAPPPPENEGRCGNFLITGIREEYGGGSVDVRMCVINGIFEFKGCDDYPDWGPEACSAVFIP